MLNLFDLLTYLTSNIILSMCTYTYIHIHIHIYINIYIYININFYIYIYIYIYINFEIAYKILIFITTYDTYIKLIYNTYIAHTVQ